MSNWLERAAEAQSKKNKRDRTSLVLAALAVGALMAAMILYSPSAEGSDLVRIVPDEKEEDTSIRDGKYLGPCYYMTEEINWTRAPRGKEPYNGDRYALDVQIQFAHTVKDVEELYVKHIGKRDFKEGSMKGFAYTNAKTPGICYVVAVMPRTVDGYEMCTLGHEIMHCLAGKFHRE